MSVTVDQIALRLITGILIIYTLQGGYTVDAILTVRPSNTVAVAGTRVELRCETDKTHFAWIRNPGTSQVKIVGENCQRDPAHSTQYSVVSTSTGQCDLVINSASLELAATYRCVDSSFYAANAELTVIEPCPLMGSRSSSVASIGDTVQLTCYINYKGADDPTLHWTSGSDTSATNCNDTVCTSQSSKSVGISSATMNLPTCSVTFPSADLIKPQCTSWNPKIIISYLATSLSIRPASSSGANNSDVNLDNGPVVLVCLATGHPEPSYVWLDLSTDSTVSVQIYLISSPGEYRLQCTASTDVTFANGSVIPHSVSARYYINATGEVSTTPMITTSSITTAGRHPITTTRSSGTTTMISTTRTTAPQTREPGDDNLGLILGIALGVGIPLIILIAILICCCCQCCLCYWKCCDWCKKPKGDRGSHEQPTGAKSHAAVYATLDTETARDQHPQYDVIQLEQRRQNDKHGHTAATAAARDVYEEPVEPSANQYETLDMQRQGDVQPQYDVIQCR